MVVRTLGQHPYFRNSVELILEFDESVVIVRGRLPSYYMKQMLQEVLKQMPAVSGVRNHVEVAPSSNG